jgi:SAM-dependent methyltransferase
VSEPDPQKKQALLVAEGRFWDLQEERIESLYARPHDWRFVPALAERIIAPRIRALERIIGGGGAGGARFGSLLDVGCGNGWFCHAAAKRGIRSIGVDLSEKKIETARRLAAEQGVAHLCEFAAGDVLAWQPREPVDLLTSHGSLHHFPDFERALDHMVTRFLKPGGRMLFIEPNFEGMSPGLRAFLMRCAHAPLVGRLFDLDFYLEVSGQPSLEAPPVETGAVNIRHESPAGKEFFGEHIDLDRFFSDHFEVLEKRFFHYFSGHATNAFHVFMKSRVVRGLWRAALPALVWTDDRLLRKPAYQAYAEEGLWYLARRGEA